MNELLLELSPIFGKLHLSGEQSVKVLQQFFKIVRGAAGNQVATVHSNIYPRNLYQQLHEKF
jgi:hypothetical protein